MRPEARGVRRWPGPAASARPALRRGPGSEGRGAARAAARAGEVREQSGRSSSESMW